MHFFENLNARLQRVPDFTWSRIVPKGANWHVLAFLPWADRAQSASIFATFTRDREMRVELYLDCGNKDQNKKLFDELYARREKIEAVAGERLQWERRDEDRACRVALYTKAQIQSDAENSTLLDWVVQKAVAFYKAFGPEFPPRRGLDTSVND
jgi:hypothetical protein